MAEPNQTVVCFLSLRSWPRTWVHFRRRDSPRSPPAKTVSADTAGFDKNVKPILKNTCSGCHNSTVISGGVNLVPYIDASTVAEDRVSWDKILAENRIRRDAARRHPAPLPSQSNAPHHSSRRIRKSRRPDQARSGPRHRTAPQSQRIQEHHSRSAGRDFRAEKDFPTDDSGYGFDNIGDVLTISPVLMEKYMNAAETIASRAMGADPLPKKPLEDRLRQER